MRSRCLRIHVRLDLEHEAGDLRSSSGCDRALARRLRARRRRELGERRRAARARRSCSRALPKNTGVRWPARYASRSNGGHSPRTIATSSRSFATARLGQQLRRACGSSRPATAIALAGRTRRSRALHQDQLVARTGRSSRGSRGPCRSASSPGVTSSCRSCAISSSSSNGSRPSRSILLMNVMIGTSRSRQTSNSLRVCVSMPLRGVDHHDGRVDRGQRAVGVLAEVLVARRVEQVERAVVVVERHHRRRHRDAALALDLHPVGARAPPLAARLDRAGELDRAAEQQQLLGQRGLAGVGVRDDRERAPPRRSCV